MGSLWHCIMVPDLKEYYLGTMSMSNRNNVVSEADLIPKRYISFVDC